MEDNKSLVRDLSWEVLAGAVNGWLMGDTKPMDETISGGEYLQLSAVNRLTLIEAKRARANGITFDDFVSRLRTLPDHTLIDNLNFDLLTKGNVISPTRWFEMWQELRRPILANNLVNIAESLRNGELEPTVAISQIESALEKERANVSNPLESICTIQLANDPETEAKCKPPDSWVDGLIFPGYINLSGPWKSGKSWWALAASICIAVGRDFLGHTVRQGRVAWLQVDMPQWAFLNYCRLLRAGMGYPACGIPFFSDSRIDLKRPDHQRQFASKLKELGTEILFIDSGRCISTVKENDSDEVAGLTRAFLCAELRDHLGITVVLITHAAKNSNGGSRGSGEWDAAADSCIIFTKSDPDNDFVGVKCKGRHTQTEFHFLIEDFSMTDGGVVIRETTAEERKAEARERAREQRGPDTRVEDFLRQSMEWHSLRDIISKAKVRYKRVKTDLEELVNRGLVEVKSGQYRFYDNCRGSI